MHFFSYINPLHKMHFKRFREETEISLLAETNGLSLRGIFVTLI